MLLLTKPLTKIGIQQPNTEYLKLDVRPLGGKHQKDMILSLKPLLLWGP